MSNFYLDPKDEGDVNKLPNVEVFYHKGGKLGDSLDKKSKKGWYYCICVPGCMPDSDLFGPFSSQSMAIEDARNNFLY